VGRVVAVDSNAKGEFGWSQFGDFLVGLEHVLEVVVLLW